MVNPDATPIKNTSRDTNYRSTNNAGGRPVKDPDSQKDFTKILGGDSDGTQEQEDDAQNRDNSLNPMGKATLVNQTPLSPFGLASQSKYNSGLDTTPPATTTPTSDSPSNLFSLMTSSSKEAKEAAFKPSAVASNDEELVALDTLSQVQTSPPSKDSSSDMDSSADASPQKGANAFTDGKTNVDKKDLSNTDGMDTATMAAKIKAHHGHSGPQAHQLAANAETVVAGEEDQKKEKFTTRFSTEQSDLSYVNLMAVNTQSMAQVNAKADKALMPVSDIQEIVNQLVDKLYSVSQSGKTDTSITLKQPPILAGAQLIVTSFDSAKGQFNISFENLTQAAKNLLDMRVNQESLLHALDQKGYTVHILTTTTLVENRPIMSDSSQNQQQQEREEGRQGQPRNRQQQNDDEEEVS